jgi:steroid Delta-isomerase
MTDQAEETLTIRELIRRSRQAVFDHDREGWLALWASDAVIQDPVGPSPFDPDGNGHHGPEGIAAFYDKVIGPNERITFEIDRSYECGNEVADVGLIRTVLPGGTHVAIVHGVFTYRSNGQGQLAGMRAYWEFSKAELVDAEAS